MKTVSAFTQMLWKKRFAGQTLMNEGDCIYNIGPRVYNLTDLDNAAWSKVSDFSIPSLGE